MKQHVEKNTIRLPHKQDRPTPNAKINSMLQRTTKFPDGKFALPFRWSTPSNENRLCQKWSVIYPSASCTPYHHNITRECSVAIHSIGTDWRQGDV